MSIDKPNYTQVPNLMLDDLLMLMGEAEIKVTLAILRQTFGYHRGEVAISISKLQEFTRLSRQGVVNGITAGLERGTLTRAEGKRGGFVYAIVINDELSTSKRSGLVNEVDQSLVNEVDQTSQRSSTIYSGLKKVLKKEGKKEGKKDVMPPPEHFQTLPGVPKPRYRKDKRDADRIARQRDKMGLNAKQLTELTNRVLIRMNGLDLADSDTDMGDEEFTQAQQTTLALASIGVKTVRAVDDLFDCWPHLDWRGKKGEVPTYKGIVEHAKALGISSAKQDETQNTSNVTIERMEGEGW